MPINSLKSKIRLPDFENQHYKRNSTQVFCEVNN